MRAAVFTTGPSEGIRAKRAGSRGPSPTSQPAARSSLTGGGRRLAGGLSGQLLAGRLATGGLPGGLLGASHVSWVQLCFACWGTWRAKGSVVLGGGTLPKLLVAARGQGPGSQRSEGVGTRLRLPGQSARPRSRSSGRHMRYGRIRRSAGEDPPVLLTAPQRSSPASNTSPHSTLRNTSEPASPPASACPRPALLTSCYERGSVAQCSASR